ncbi:MAG: DNA recombination protein RmuC [Chlamydiae bacterium]|nr:DNA recombination protein RmuC [Chlamydiota bacterium]
MSLYIVGTALVLSFLFFQKKIKDLSMACALAEQKANRVEILENELEQKREECLELRLQNAADLEKIAFLTQSQEALNESFKSLSFDALEKNNKAFLTLAKATLDSYQVSAKEELEKRHTSMMEAMNPVKEALGKIDFEMKALEKDRKGDHEALKEHLKLLVDSEKHLRMETSMLVKALRAPIGRGRWGEIQLKRVVELAGMLNYCDFFEQFTVSADEGQLRPDLVVKLPGGRQVVVDAKVPLEAYLEATSTQDEDLRLIKLKDHARQVRQHLSALSKKAYWEHFHPSPEMVVLFLPAEAFFSAALEQDPSLLEAGMEQKVIIATPTTLIALLRAIAYGWKQENLSRHAQEVSKLGHELYKRLCDMGGHFTKMGKSLSSAVDSYNKGVSSLESRVFVTARKFKELGAASSHIECEELSLIEKLTKPIHISDLNSCTEEVS